MKKRIAFFHVLNDNSGSPHILSLIIRGLIEKGFLVDLYTSSTSKGFLSNIQGVNYHRIYYKFYRNKIFTSFLLIIAQIRYFLAVLKYTGKSGVTIYINTILPFGAALAAKLIRKKLVYHIHENPVNKNIIQKIGIYIFLKNADKAIFVSNYVYNSFQLEQKKKVLVYNAISPDFVKTSEQHEIKFHKPENILLICSLKAYKGVNIFVDLAMKLLQYKFTLVLNANRENIKTFFKGKTLPQNLIVYPTKTDLHPFYSNSQLVVNLSLTDGWIETFGLTILEAMSYGIPVIIPPVGGITELVDDGINGFKVDSRDLNTLMEKINYIFSDKEIYSKMSVYSKLKSKQFSYLKMIDSIERVLIED